VTLRYAWRSLAKSKGFVAIAVVALGAGLGLSTTMFAVMDAVLHPYQPYRDPETLFGVRTFTGRRNPLRQAEMYRWLRDNVRSFAAVVPISGSEVTLRVDGEDEGAWASRVTPRYFAVTGVRVARGRVFTASDGGDVAIVSSALWKRLYGKRRDLSGARLTTSDRAYAIVGVMPEGADLGRFPNVWLPLDSTVETSGLLPVATTARLRAGVTREQAHDELKRLADLLTGRFGMQEAPFGFELLPRVIQAEETKDIHKAMIGAALLVLLIACVNLAHLMLARGIAKKKELALRMALGASRAAVVRQMFLECVLITAAGIALGAVITLWGADLLQHRMPREVTWVGMVRPQLSWRVFALGAGAAVASIVVFGLLPAVRVALAVDVNDPLKDDAGTTTGRHRHRYSALVISEVGLALVLIMAAGLLLRTVIKLAAEKMNFETRTLYTAWIQQQYKQDSTGRWRADTVGAARRRNALFETARNSDQVADIAFAGWYGLRGGGLTAELTDTTRLVYAMSYKSVTPNYVTVLGLPILRGRNFLPGDAAGRGVAIIDPIAAQALYRNEDPVGKMLKLGGPATDAPWVPIVGVMRSPSALVSNNRMAPPPTVLVARSDTGLRGEMLIRMKSTDPRAPAVLQTRMREATGSSVRVMPYDYDRQAELVSRWFLAQLFVGMGVVALALAAMGIYGVLAYAVSRRMREFAVRIALGAQPRQLTRMVLHDGAVMLLGGIGAGAFAALAASRYLDAVLIAVMPSDVVALVLSETVLVGVGLAAALAPARRAARANPLDIIRAV
jgi:putative ABC transport system permease protein